MKYILASESPRRKKLLKSIVRKFEVVPSQVQESYVKGKSPLDIAMDNALRKAQDVSDKFPEALVIGADTVVVIDELILGKPGDREEAIRMLETLSGQPHTVITGVAMVHGETASQIVDFDMTEVIFKPLSDEDIREYVKGGSCMDKAGAYGIQEVNDSFVESIEGSYDNVVGLPTHLVADMLDMMIEQIYRNKKVY